MNILKGSAVLKLAALVVALLTYYYIHNEIMLREKSNSADASYKLIKLTAKTLPVKVRLVSTPPDGFRILENRVTVTPSQVTVIGPEALLENAWTVETAIVDVSESTKTTAKKIPLESVAGIHIVGQPYAVDVAVPIEKIPEPAIPAKTVSAP